MDISHEKKKETKAETKIAMDISLEKKKETKVAIQIVARVEGSTVTIIMGSVMAKVLLAGPEITSLRSMLGINLLQSMSKHTFCLSTVALGAGVSKKVQKQVLLTEESINEKAIGDSANNLTEMMQNSCSMRNNQGKNSLLMLGFQDMGLGAVGLSEEFDQPPGFELHEAQSHSPVRQMHSISEARRSPRIKRKMDGPYVPMIERAQRVLGYDAQPKKKKNAKPKPPAKPSRTYMQNKDPLSEIQANLVVAAAGIELEETLQDKVVKTAMTPSAPSAT